MENLQIRTPDGSTVITAQYRVIQLETVITSDDPGYNQSLQPRNRDTVSSRAQIQRIAMDIHPELLMESYTTDTGAPIVDQRLQVISGNGRTLSLLAAKGETIQRDISATEIGKSFPNATIAGPRSGV